MKTKLPWRGIGAGIVSAAFSGVAVFSYGVSALEVAPFAALVFAGSWLLLRLQKKQSNLGLSAEYLEGFVEKTNGRLAEIKKSARQGFSQENRDSLEKIIVEAENYLHYMHQFPQYYESNIGQLSHLLTLLEGFLELYERASQNKSARNITKIQAAASVTLPKFVAAFEEAYANLGSSDVVRLDSFGKVLDLELASENLNDQLNTQTPNKEGAQ